MKIKRSRYHTIIYIGKLQIVIDRYKIWALFEGNENDYNFHISFPRIDFNKIERLRIK